jgi:mRNA interferase HigB
MRLVGIAILDEAVKKHPRAKKQLDAWTSIVKCTKWSTPQDLKSQFGKTDFLGDKQAVFNIRGDEFRLLVKVDYENEIVMVMKFDTHKEYDRWKL